MPAPASNNDQGRSSALGKSFAVLRVLRRASTPLTLTAVAESVGIAPSSAHSVLGQLLHEDAVIQDADKRYQLGPSLFYLGSAYARNAKLYRSLWMELVQASNELAVTAAIAVTWDNHHLVLNSHRAGDSNVAVPFGGRVPLGGSSWGKVYYAWSGAALPKKLERYTSASLTERAEYEREIEEVRARGYATDREEFSLGVGGVASPVTSSAGYEGLASFLAPMSRVDAIGIEQLGDRLSTLAARASLALGDKARMRFFGSE